MISADARSFSFPSSAQILLGARRDQPPEDQAPLREATERGYSDGLAQGRQAAEAEAQRIRASAHREGFDAGRAEAITRIQQAAAALQEALAGFEHHRAEIARQAESFCVDLVVAAFSRLIESDQARSQFATQLVIKALEVLSPEPPQAIYLNPADHQMAALELQSLPIKDDHALASGHARVEAGRLVVEGGIDQAFEQIKSAMLDTRERRLLGSKSR